MTSDKKTDGTTGKSTIRWKELEEKRLRAYADKKGVSISDFIKAAVDHSISEELDKKAEEISPKTIDLGQDWLLIVAVSEVLGIGTDEFIRDAIQDRLDKALETDSAKIFEKLGEIVGKINDPEIMNKLSECKL